MKTGQVNVVSAVLLVGIIISLVSSAYLWGLPIVQKRESTITAQANIAFAMKVYEKIRDMAKTCSGECMESIPITINGAVKVVGADEKDENDNSIIIETALSEDIFCQEEECGWIPWNTQNIDNATVYGEEDGVVFIKSFRGTANNFIVRYKIWFRELYSTKGTQKSRLIELVRGDITSATSGNIVLTYQGIEIKPNGGYMGRPLEVIRIKVNF